MAEELRESKVTFGLKNAYYAVITEGEDGSYTYGDPVRIPGAVELALDPKGDDVTDYADDGTYFWTPNNQGYEGTLTIKNIPQSFAKDCLGEEIDEQDFVQTEYSDAKPKAFALMYEVNGDGNKTRHVHYNCRASRPSIGSKTRGESIETNSPELKFISTERPSDGRIKDKTTAKTPKEVYENWYKAVYEKKTMPAA